MNTKKDSDDKTPVVEATLPRPKLGEVTEAQAEKAFDAYYSKPKQPMRVGPPSLLQKEIDGEKRAQAKQRDKAQPLMLCSKIRYVDGETLSAEAVRSKPRETVCKILELQAHAERLAEALKSTLSEYPPSQYRGKHLPPALESQIREALAAWEAAQ